MKIVECTCENCNELTDFVKEMLENWADKSSLSKSNTCCPNRDNNEIFEKIKDTKNSTFYYASDDDKVMGFLCTEVDTERESLYISYINVAPKYRRQNVFRELLGYAEKAAAEKNLRYLRLDTWAGNDTALKSFDNLGFIVEHSCSCTVKLYKPL